MFIKIFTLGIKRLDATADDYATNISRNRVSFNVCESDKRDQRRLSKLSSINSKQMANTSSLEVLSFKVIKELSSYLLKYLLLVFETLFFANTFTAVNQGYTFLQAIFRYLMMTLIAYQLSLFLNAINNNWILTKISYLFIFVTKYRVSAFSSSLQHNQYDQD